MKMKINKKIVFSALCLLVLFICFTSLWTYSNSIETRVLIVKNITPVFDEESGVIVNDDGVVFNDKNQKVEYKVVIENTKNYDVKVTDIKLTTPTEDFLEYEVENLKTDDVVKANGTKELVVSFETIKKEGWGRNFEDELTANISFAKVVKQEEEKPTPKPEDDIKDENDIDKKPVIEEYPKDENKEETKEEVIAPVRDTTELKEKFELIEDYDVEENEIVFNDIQKVVDKQKIDVWIYSDPIYLGRFEVEVKDGKTKIIGLSEALEKHGIEEGNHSLVLQSEAGEKIGYIEVKVDNKKFEKPVKEEIVPDGDVSNKIEDDTYEKEEAKEEHEDTKKNKSNALVIVLVIVTGIAGTAVVVILVVNKKKKKLAVILVLISGISLVKADELIELPITFNVSFESQNVMKPSGWKVDELGDLVGLGNDYWSYPAQIVNFYIENEIEEITEFEHEFDVSNEQNGRVKAYLVKNETETGCIDLIEGTEADCYDLHLQADGMIYPNSDASFYFYYMALLKSIDNLEGFDTSNVTNMSQMFAYTGYNSTNFTLDLSSFDTSNVTDMSYMFFDFGGQSSSVSLDVSNFDNSKVTDMSYMFSKTGYSSDELSINLSNFDTSNVTDMSNMFSETGNDSTNFILDVRSFDTSNVTDMSSMFSETGYNNPNFTLDLSSFDTSKVTDMGSMFYRTGYNSTNFTLDVSNFDTNKVTNMIFMFYDTGYNSTNFTLDVSNFDTSNVTDMSSMFSGTGHNSTNFTLDVRNFDTSKVTDMSSMFSGTGRNSTNFTLDVRNFDTSNVTDMGYMFSGTGHNSTNFTLDVSNFDTSNVTNMGFMFSGAGSNSMNFTLDLSSFDTSNVTNMRGMFFATGYNSTNITLDLSSFDTSNVTDMSDMFYQTGYNSTSFVLDISNFDTSKVTNMNQMFAHTGFNSMSFTLDVGDFDTSNVTHMVNMFYQTGHNSTKLNVVFTIRNVLTEYMGMFYSVATKEGSQIIVNYTSANSSYIDNYIATKTFSSNVIKGICVDCD